MRRTNIMADEALHTAQMMMIIWRNANHGYASDISQTNMRHNLFNFISAVVGVVSSQMSVSSSVSRSECNLPSDFVKGHAVTMRFTVCYYPHSQTAAASHAEKFHCRIPQKVTWLRQSNAHMSDSIGEKNSRIYVQSTSSIYTHFAQLYTKEWHCNMKTTPKHRAEWWIVVQCAIDIRRYWAQGAQDDGDNRQ